ncbi:RidA family protein [Paenibacillus thiaminolyticus]|uniref:RidA family protein n=1 Tax=Paenibacillus thiaminolyticus TaxID=49283 RepID=A0AAP9DTI8_PANTH|nr:RidA family protein [Paenibacillus thiaminolyticus]MCY9537591.1 RidA family protein [Paenibacillus thiaminolyticus]MCY9600704.1 RidA family protein [Paenibacillus thiaminolyticus]MCY9607532.1 RidA family protein [Paenibacillus thiaminolyticus]MCY9611332.1 RidA family protein [Paenibacillus thiaminolyticus]MCY9617397.1 RidA family protein [Paenibacillus thiaminolyticus]
MVKRIPTPFSYSSAVAAGDYVFIGLHRGFGDTFTQQIHDTFAHLTKTLQQCNASLDHVVKVNVYLKNIKDLPEMEKVFFDYFEADACPARMTSTTEFIDSDCLLMMDGVAYHPSSH